MFKYLLLAIIYSVVLNSCAPGNQENPALFKIPQSKAMADFEVFGAILKKAHPSLNLYVSRQRLLLLLDSIQNSIPAQVTIGDLFNKITFVANEIGCSHTIIEFPGSVYDTLQNRKYFFPYPVKWIDDKLLVNAVGCDLPEGTEIKFINQEPVKKIIRELAIYNPVEGFHRKTQQNIAGDNFSLQYFYKYGERQIFNLRVIDTAGREREVSYAGINLSEWYERDDYSRYYYDPTEVTFDLNINSQKKYAYLRLTTFDFVGTQKQNAYENFCFNSFELLQHKKNIRSLIIDLRENKGGELFNAFLLYSFLTDKPFAEFEKVISKIKSIPYNEYLDPEFINNKEKDLNEKLQEKFTVHLKNNHYSLPDSLVEKWDPDKIHFNGNVYVITNSAVVSSASYFAGMIQNAGRGKIIGEETAGGAYSGNGYTTLKYALPGSKIRISFPYAHLVYSIRENSNSGHGLRPDYDIPDSYESFKQNKDRQFMFVLDSLILNNKQF